MRRLIKKQAQRHKAVKAQSKNRLRHYIALCKIKISLFSTLSAATGYILTGQNSDPAMVLMLAGVFLLACGACALNQYQERETDALMERTRSRPLPSGSMRPGEALFFTVTLILTGSLLLLETDIHTALLGAAAVLWYNGVYTHLKRWSSLASIPGALTGAVPPAMGWSAAGADLLDFRLLVLCAFFFIWQVPHFWLLSLKYGEDYKKAGFPGIGEIFSKVQISRITFVWILSTAVTGLILPLYIFPAPHVLNAAFAGTSLWLVLSIIGKGGLRPFPVSFNRINLYMLLSMLLLNGKQLIHL